MKPRRSPVAVSSAARCWRGAHEAVLLALALLLSACGLRSGGRVAETQAVAWLVSSSRDGAIELAHPPTGSSPRRPRKLGLVSPTGAVSVADVPRRSRKAKPSPSPRTCSTAEFACSRRSGFEPTGRRVWMGESLVWHGSPGPTPPRCSNCTSRYSVEMLAFPEPARPAVGVALLPRRRSSDLETVQLLLDMLNTLALSVVGSA